MKELENAVPIDGVEYPINVIYCGVCTLPLEYCENCSNDKQACRAWAEQNAPELFKCLYISDDPSIVDQESSNVIQESAASASQGDAASRKSKRGGKGTVKKSKATASSVVVKIKTEQRGKQKSVQNLKAVGVDIKDAAKFFSKKFACSSSVQTGDEILIQGDVADELFDLIKDKFKIDEDNIELIEGKK